MRIRLDVVQADDRYREMIKERTTWRHLPFQIFYRGRGDGSGADIKAALQFLLPLIDKVRRAKDGEARHFPTIHEFTHNQPGFNGFADTYVIGDQQTGDLLTQRHHQGHQLVHAGFYGDIAKERKGPAPERRRISMAS